MLDLFRASSRNCEGISRRSLLKIGGLGLGSLALPDLLRLRAQDRAEGRTTSDTAVILLWMDGGPSQFETYDPKPDAPAEYRGPYQTIQTNVVGLNLCELLPMHAQIAEKIAVVRSVAHRESGHGSAVKNLNTGYLHPPGTNEGTFLYPGIGAVVGKSRLAAMAAPALMSYASTASLVLDVVDGAYELAGPAMEEGDIRRFRERNAA